MPRLLTDRELLSEFRRQLGLAQQVDFASAWATEGPALEALAETDIRVRALVGLQQGITTPDAIRRLKQTCELRVVQGSRLFHPKVYVFRRARGSIAWIGSANFTGKGFAPNGRGNEEAVFETHLIPAIADWFEHRWREAGPLDEDALERYCSGYQHPQLGALDERPAPTEDVHGGADAVFLETISARRAENPEALIEEAPYHAAVLQALHRLGGSGSRGEVLDVVYEILEPVLRDGDLQEVQQSVAVWEHRADNARINYLLPEELIQPTSEAGWGRRWYSHRKEWTQRRRVIGGAVGKGFAARR